MGSDAKWTVGTGISLACLMAGLAGLMILYLGALLGSVEARLDSIDARLENVESDVQILLSHAIDSAAAAPSSDQPGE